jgi:hypothetical protein
MDNAFSRLETRLQRLIEEGTARIFSAKDVKSLFATRLVERMQAEVQFGENGQLIAPNIYTIAISEDDSLALEENKHLIGELEVALRTAASQSEIVFLRDPVLQFKSTKNVLVGDIEIVHAAFEEELSKTQSLDLREENHENSIPFGAFFIVNGSNIFPLTKNIVNIGRKNDNHLVIDSSSVSRRHAQLRSILGAYHFFDLGSTGGSTINGKEVSKAILLAGDVISLAGVPIIYGQDSSPAEAATQDIQISESKNSEEPTSDINSSR